MTSATVVMSDPVRSVLGSGSSKRIHACHGGDVGARPGAKGGRRGGAGGSCGGVGGSSGGPAVAIGSRARQEGPFSEVEQPQP